MVMKRTLCCLLLVVLGLGWAICPAQTKSDQSALEAVDKVDQYFRQVKDVQVDIVLTTNLHLFGCSGGQTYKGTGFFKQPDRLKAVLDGVTYFASGNKIRKIDADGKKFYVKLLHSLDFAPGFRPSLISHNFYLQTIEEDEKNIVIKATPKPGVLKNVTLVFFYISKNPYLVKELDVKFVNMNLRGKLNIDYQKIKGIWAPTSLSGQSAIVIPGGFLVGMDLNLSASNIKMNTGLPASLFDPGF